ncbi:MAG TPA: NADH-quinone oxidoreductase subunit K [Frankiaceae bacterium]|nr:NADH-quinone oxidoreductase subunit K [Frankiaceae bacterium]
MTILPYLVAAFLLLAGLAGAVISRDLIRTIVALSVAQSGTYVLLLGIGWRRGGSAPVFADVDPGTRTVDPIVQALCLTDVVVGATVLSLLLALAVKVHQSSGSRDPDALTELGG